MNKIDGLKATMALGARRRFSDGNPGFTLLHHVCLMQHIWMRMGYPFEEMGYLWVIGHRDAGVGDMPLRLQVQVDLTAVNAKAEAQLCKDLQIKPPSDEARERLNVVEKMALVFEAMDFGPPDFQAFTLFDQQEARRWFERLARCFPEHVDRLSDYFFDATQQEPPSVWLPGTHQSERGAGQLMEGPDAVLPHALPPRDKKLLSQGDR